MKLLEKSFFKRLAQIALPMMILIGIIIGCAQVKRVQIAADHNAQYVRAVVTKVEADHSGGAPYEGPQTVRVTIKSGEYKNYTCVLENANDYATGAFCQEGTKVIALIYKTAEGTLAGTVHNYDRSGMIWLLSGLFALIMVLVGGKKGAAALYALVFTFICIVCVFVPLLYIGMNGILAAIITAALILSASIYIMNGWSVKSLCAIIGTTLGVAISGVLAMIIGQMFHLSGMQSEDVESLLYISRRTNLDVSNILYGGILISSLGAVMDVSVSMVSAMDEVLAKAPHLKPKDLFQSGMRVGRDMMGTMSNTLILAYAGSATSTLLYVYAYEMTFVQTMGYNSITIEILCGLCGTIGVILTVPLVAAIAAIILKPKTRKKK